MQPPIANQLVIEIDMTSSVIIHPRQITSRIIGSSFIGLWVKW